MAAYPSNGASVSAMVIYLYQKDSVNRIDVSLYSSQPKQWQIGEVGFPASNCWRAEPGLCGELKPLKCWTKDVERQKSCLLQICESSHGASFSVVGEIMPLRFSPMGVGSQV